MVGSSCGHGAPVPERPTTPGTPRDPQLEAAGWYRSRRRPIRRTTRPTPDNGRLTPQRPATPPAYYAAHGGGWRQWRTVLHPPYTAWHLAYVVLGAALAPQVDVTTLVATLVAFFLAVGLAAHALDELQGRPLRTSIPAGQLLVAVGIGLAGATALGAYGVTRVGWVLVPCIVAGVILVVAYNAELFGGILHSDLGFALAWGAFPVLTAYVAETRTMAVAPVLAAGGAFALSVAQRRLSTPARLLRRHTVSVTATMHLDDGRTTVVDQPALLAPLEQALRATSWAVVLLATALVVARLT